MYNVHTKINNITRIMHNMYVYIICILLLEYAHTSYSRVVVLKSSSSMPI